MLRYLFLGVLLVHGLIHFLGLIKSLGIVRVQLLSQAVSLPEGVMWLLAGLLLFAAGFLYALRIKYWPYLAFPGIVLSQIMILSAWPDAKFGTLANVLIGLVAVAGLAQWRFERSFRADVRQNLSRAETELLTEADLASLPAPVQRYLRYCGAVGQPKVYNMRVTFQGQMRNKGSDWFPFHSEQYNFFDRPARLFFMNARVKHLPALGYHAYREREAGMQVKLFGLFPVADIGGTELFKTETVTFLNDLCILAPGALVYERIRWEAVDDTTARATFTNQGTTVEATLAFAPDGRLLNFISDDRGALTDGQLEYHRFSTPLSDYRDFGGYRLAALGKAVWHYPDGPFTYGEFRLQDVSYNVSAFNP